MPSAEASVKSSPIVFGTDGWRARIAEDFTFQNVRKTAWALGQYLNRRTLESSSNGKSGVFVGYDRRFASKEFAEAAAGVLAGMGFSVRMIDAPLPTPALSYLCKKYRLWALVVTASHNPPLDNGIKIKTPEGGSAPQAVTSELERLVREAPETFESARCLPDPKIRKEYLGYLKELAKGLGAKMGSRKIVVDYFHGCGSGLLEEVLGESRVIALRPERDPLFGGVAPEPVEKNLTELKQRIKKDRALMGVALDGDADRISLVDEKGNYLAPTLVFPMYAYYHALVKKEKGEVVQGVSLGYLGERIARKAGLPFKWVSVGFKNIAERVASGNVLVGGEESGGYCLGRLLPDRDGAVNAILMLRILLDLKMKPSELVKKICREFGASYYERYDLRLKRPVDKNKLLDAACEELIPRLEKKGFEPADKLTIDGLKLFMKDGSWLLMRPSGTEPLVRIYAEMPTKAKTQALLKEAAAWAEKAVEEGRV